MKINKRVKNIRSVFRWMCSQKQLMCMVSVLAAGGICIAYGLSKVENTVMTYVPAVDQDKPVIVLAAGHGKYVLNRVAGAIWFLTLKSSERTWGTWFRAFI